MITGAINRRAKLQSNHHHQLNQHPAFYRPEARCPSCRPTRSVKALKETKKTTSMAGVNIMFWQTSRRSWSCAFVYVCMVCAGMHAILCEEESINDSVSVNLGIDHSGAIGNNDLVVAVQR